MQADSNKVRPLAPVTGGEAEGQQFGIAPIRNVAKFVTLIERLQRRNPELPAIGVFYGPAGRGKSKAAAHAAVNYQAVVIQAEAHHPLRAICEMILEELGIRPASYVYKMVAQIQQALLAHDVPLIIDEADNILTGQKIQLIKAIHDGSGVPVILIGEELLPQKLKAWERVHSRVLNNWVTADNATEADLRALMPFYAAGIEIAPPMQAKILQESAGSIRRLCGNLEMAREIARAKGLARVEIEHWGGRPFIDSKTPDPRRGMI